MAGCLMHRLRGLAVLVRSYKIFGCCVIASMQPKRIVTDARTAGMTAAPANVTGS